MEGRAAGRHKDVVEGFDFIFRKGLFAEAHKALIDFAEQTVANGLGLFEDFFHHVVIETFFAGTFHAPFHGFHFFVDDLAVVVDGVVALFDNHEIVVV